MITSGTLVRVVGTLQSDPAEACADEAATWPEDGVAVEAGGEEPAVVEEMTEDEDEDEDCENDEDVKDGGDEDAAGPCSPSDWCEEDTSGEERVFNTRCTCFVAGFFTSGVSSTTITSVAARGGATADDDLASSGLAGGVL